MIDKVTEYDTGLYSCKVKSPMGSVEKNFTLYVYGGHFKVLRAFLEIS